jgi:hypothetical protein
MNQQYPQPPHAQIPPQFQPQPPKKKMGAGKVILIVVASVFGLLIVIGALAGGGESGTKTEDTAAKDKAPAAQTTTKAPAPAPATTKASEAPKSTAPAKPAAPKVACADQDDRSKPCDVKVGAAFNLGKHTVLAGWKTKNTGAGDGLGMTITGKAKNTSDEASTMFVHIKFLKGGEVLANIMCNTGDLEPGQTEAMNCIADGVYTRTYDKVTAEATF